MDLNNILVIYRKDLKEILSLRTVKYSIIIIPFIILLLLLFILFVSHINMGNGTDLNPIINETLSYLPTNTQGKLFYYISMNYLIFLSIVPLSIASTISSYSVVGEKQQKTIEPILATPIDDYEFFIGKMLAPLIPTLGISYIVIAIYTIFSDIISSSYGYILYPNIYWVLIVFLFVPSSTVLMILLTLFFSSRVVDPRSAQQFSAIILIPVLVIFFLNMLIYSLGSILFILLTIIIVILDFVVFSITIKTFHRETIITRWK